MIVSKNADSFTQLGRAIQGEIFIDQFLINLNDMRKAYHKIMQSEKVDAAYDLSVFRMVKFLKESGLYNCFDVLDHDGNGQIRFIPINFFGSLLLKAVDLRHIQLKIDLPQLKIKSNDNETSA